SGRPFILLSFHVDSPLEFLYLFFERVHHRTHRGRVEIDSNAQIYISLDVAERWSVLELGPIFFISGNGIPSYRSHSKQLQTRQRSVDEDNYVLVEFFTFFGDGEHLFSIVKNASHFDP